MFSQSTVNKQPGIPIDIPHVETLVGIDNGDYRSSIENLRDDTFKT